MQATLTVTELLFHERRAGTLTPERYAELERQGFEEIERIMATDFPDMPWMRDDLRTEITRYRPGS
jgi:hypothetical protein